MVFDAVALVLSDDAGDRLAKEAAAVDFVRDAFGHLKAIAFDQGARAVLEAAGIEPDAGVVDAGEREVRQGGDDPAVGARTEGADVAVGESESAPFVGALLGGRAALRRGAT